MKKHYTLMLFIAIILASCTKKDTFDAAAQATADDSAIQAYLAAHTSIKATKDPSGLYYQIVTQGTGANATSTSAITANYTGTLLDGTVFDKTTNNAFGPFSLSGVITGWQIGIPLVKAGGRIMLLIPSALGYGNSAQGSIPANSVLIFTIDVLTVK